MHSKRAFFLRVLAVFVCVVTVASPTLAQNFYGSIVGTVTDSTGAPMEGATVTAINAGTATRQVAQSSASGEYRIANLVPGNYRLDIEKTGFKRLTRENLAVQVESVIRLDSAMQVGDVNQSIEVEASAPLLQTENASLSQVVSTRSVEQLPMNGRNILNLVNLVPGVVPQGSSDGSLTGKNVFAAGNYQIGGGTANQSATFFDGVPVNITYGNITALTPSPDAVAEFRVQTSNNTAEYGRYTGGVINIASKGGTNEFHGTAYEYLRNKLLNATDFFANKSGVGRPPFVQNQFGGAVGGPVRKDKTFFFFNYEAFRARQGALFTRTVPLPEQYTGDFSGYKNASGAVIPIYDPNTQCGAYNNPACGTTQRTQFPGNVIPQSRINPVAAKLLAFPLYAKPNGDGQAFTHNLNFNKNASTGGDNDQMNIRGDHQLTEKQRLLARFTRWSSSNLPVTPYDNGMRNGDPYSPEHFVTTQAVLADTWVLNPNQILDVRAGVTRWYYTRIPGSLGTDEATLGFPSYFSQVPVLNGLVPSTTIPGVAISSPTLNTISTGLLLGRDMTYALTPTFTWIKGRHALKVGAEFHRNDLNYFQNNNPGGTFSFDNLFTAATNTGGASGSGMASFLLGLSNNSSLVQTSLFTYAQLYYQGYFVTDTWQATNKLTVTAGLRWEIPGVYRERYDRQAVFNPTELNPALKGVLVSGNPVIGAFDLVNSPLHPEKGLNPEHYGLVAPRIGLAYRLSDRTVIRTGGGVFYIPSNVQFSQGPYGNAAAYYNNAQNATIDSSVTYATTLSNPFPTGLIAAPGRNPIYQANLLGGSLGGKGQLRFENAGYTEQWNFTVQHQFPHDFALEAGYAGLRGIHLPLGLQFNQIDPKYLALGSALKNQVANPFFGVVSTGTLSARTVQAGQLLLPFPQYQTLTDPGNYSGDSTYHALQVKAEKRFSSGGTLLGAYTYSKILANVETLTSWLDSGTGVAGYQNVYDMRSEKALSSFDSRQRLTVSYVYDLPMGKGRAFLGSVSGFADRIVSGWGINGVTTFQKGFPLGITATPNNTGLNTGLRPNVVAGCQKTVDGSAQSKITGWFNTACFTTPAIYTFGNEARTDPILRGPGIANYDFSVFKNTAVTERVKVEFRAEAFNLFNRVQFGSPNLGQTTAANNLFGQITTQQNTPRLVQMALRLRF
jgi:hypothetical protein